MALGDEVAKAGDPQEEEDLVDDGSAPARSNFQPAQVEPVFYEEEEVEQVEEEQEMLDPQDVRKETCADTQECLTVKCKFEACNERVSNSPGTTETCEEELFDFLHCVDKCVAKCLFEELK